MDDISLLGYPVRLGALQQQRQDEIVREFQLLAMSIPESRTQVPGRLLELVGVLTSQFAAEMVEPQRLREQAAASGVAQVDLSYPVRPGMREAVLAWETMMREVDDYCRRGTLLALAAPAEVVALREWTLGEFLRQLDGAQPARWSGPV
ncbi:MAG: hypothetical protein KY451_00650 [Actinobacteria bacterium]|nr:hypothetical protein [Actinomycetota bacterium]